MRASLSCPPRRSRYRAPAHVWQLHHFSLRDNRKSLYRVDTETLFFIPHSARAKNFIREAPLPTVE